MQASTTTTTTVSGTNTYLTIHSVPDSHPDRKYVMLGDIRVEEGKACVILQGLGPERKPRLCQIQKIMNCSGSLQTRIVFNYTNAWGNQEEWCANATHLTMIRHDGTYC